LSACDACGSHGWDPTRECSDCGRVKCELCDVGDDVPCAVCETGDDVGEEGEE